MLILPGVCGYEDSILARRLSTPSSGRLHVIRRWQRVLPHLRGTSRNMRDSGHNLPSGRFESHWYINDFLGTISPNPAITAKLPGDHHRPHESAQNSREITTAPHKSIHNSHALAPISNCRKSKRPSHGTIPTRRARFQTGTMPAQQPHERNQAPSKSSICGTDFLPNSMVCCASDAASAPGRVMTMHGTLITLNLSLSSGKCAIS